MAGQIVRDFERHWSEIEIKDEDTVLVAEEDSLVGFVAIWCRPIPFIDSLHVRPSHRSKRVGSALMKANASPQGVTPQYCRTSPKIMEESHLKQNVSIVG